MDLMQHAARLLTLCIDIGMLSKRYWTSLSSWTKATKMKIRIYTIQIYVALC